MRTITTHLLRSNKDPNYTFFAIVPTNSLYDITYSDGAPLLHEEAVADLYLVLNPVAKLDIHLAAPQVTIAVDGTVGQTFMLEVSTDLKMWQGLIRTTLTTDHWVYTDTPPTGDTTRYYRAWIL